MTKVIITQDDVFNLKMMRGGIEGSLEIAKKKAPPKNKVKLQEHLESIEFVEGMIVTLDKLIPAAEEAVKQLTESVNQNGNNNHS